MDDIQKQIAAYCKQLKLSATLAERAMTEKGADNQEYLCHLLGNEVESRRQSRLAKYLNAAGFPKRYENSQYRTDEIDFPDGVSFQSLLDLDFYHAGRNVIMYGGTGTGKTMLSVLIGMSACRAWDTGKVLPHGIAYQPFCGGQAERDSVTVREEALSCRDSYPGRVRVCALRPHGVGAPVRLPVIDT